MLNDDNCLFRLGDGLPVDLTVTHGANARYICTVNMGEIDIEGNQIPAIFNQNLLCLLVKIAPRLKVKLLTSLIQQLIEFGVLIIGFIPLRCGAPEQIQDQVGRPF